MRSIPIGKFLLGACIGFALIGGLVAAVTTGETSIDTVTAGVAVESSGIGLDTRTTSTGEASLGSRFAGTNGFLLIVK